MQIETLHDVLQWTKNMHQQLHDFTAHCALERDNERIGLLLEHISEHEQNIALLIKEFADNGKSSVLNTYCREYYEKRAICINTECGQLFATMDMDEIAAAILQYHKHNRSVTCVRSDLRHNLSRLALASLIKIRLRTDEVY